MVDKVTLTNLANLQNETTAVNAINANNAALTTAIDNTLSRDGTSPNQMGANLDMNSFRIVNLPTAVASSEPITYGQLPGLISSITTGPTGATGATGAAGSGVSGGSAHQVALYSASATVSGGVTVGNAQILIGQTSADPTSNAISGDITLSASGVTALVNIPTATPAVGTILHTNIAAPASPAAGKVSIYSDGTDLRFHDKNASGVIGTTVVADTGASNNFLTAISAAGAISKAQPSFTNLSGSVSAAQMPALTGDVTTSAGAVATTLTDTAPALLRVRGVESHFYFS